MKLNEIDDDIKKELNDLMEKDLLKQTENNQKSKEKKKKRKKKTEKTKEKNKPQKEKFDEEEELYFIKESKKSIVKTKKIFYIIFFVFVLLFSFVVIRIFTLEVWHVVDNQNLNTYYQEQTIKEETDPASRGVIYDRNGKPLAVNITEYKMTAVLDKNNKKYNEKTKSYDGYYIKNPDDDYNKIIKILNFQNNSKAQKLIYDQLHLDAKQYKQIEFGVYGQNISQDQKDQLEKANISGLYFEPNYDRYYPYGEFASYLLGYAIPQTNDNSDSSQIEGMMGIEKMLDAYLKGENGLTKKQIDYNAVTKEGSENIIKPKMDGSDIHLTIDSQIQTFLHDSMKSALKKQTYDKASTLVMDAHSGEILAAESFPTFDPNNKASDIKDFNDPFSQTCYEPGSTIKTFLVAEAIEEGKWDGNKTYTSGKRVDEKWGHSNNKENNYIADWLFNESGETWGTTSWEEAFYFSSNVGMTYILDDVGYENWEKFATDKFELGKPLTGQVINSKSCDFSPENSFETATTTFGQGMTANMLQILRGYSVFANDGYMINPYFVESVNDPNDNKVVYKGIEDHPDRWKKGENGVEENSNGQYKKKVLSKETSDKMLKLLSGAMNYNGGYNKHATGYSYSQATKNEIAGKTGTSQVVVNGSYNNNNGIYSAAILAPADDPEIILYTTVSNPATIYPNQYMKEYISYTIDNTLNYLNKENVEKKVKTKDINIINTPNYINKDNSEIKKINKENKITYLKIGQGKVIKQYPTANSKITNNTKIILLGEKYDKEEFIGLSKTDMNNYCTLLDKECKYNGKGDKVKKIEIKEEEIKIST